MSFELPSLDLFINHNLSETDSGNSFGKIRKFIEMNEFMLEFDFSSVLPAQMKTVRFVRDPRRMCGGVEDVAFIFLTCRT